MSRKWIVIIGIAVLLIIVFVVLYYTGALANLSWQKLAIYFAAGSGPAKLAYDKLVQENPNLVKDILENREEIIKKDKKERQVLDKQIETKKAELIKMNAEIDTINVKLEKIEEKKKTIQQEVSTMNVEEKKTEFKDLFGE